MPPGDDYLKKLSESVGPLRCAIELPASWRDFFDHQGADPTRWAEKRRFPRPFLRGVAAMHCRPTLPCLVRPDLWYKVYTKDISRTGLGFLHSEQLFPAEQLALALPDGRIRSIEVVRCRRIQERCFEVGATFIAKFREDAASKPGSSKPG